jgi:hypothetical protein
MNDLAHAADRFVLGELNGEDLSMAAAEALARGLDSPALVRSPVCTGRTAVRLPNCSVPRWPSWAW